ncbi:MAG TPA: VOC family protein [Chitinophagales bacterium]|nr:VOC family protein [Chitinophagales bacterium]
MIKENTELAGLTFHHVGLLVDNIEDSINHYITLFGEENVSKVFRIESQQVKVCFVKVGVESYIELVEPMHESSVVYKLLKKRVSYYHIGYKVQDIIASINRLEALNYKPMDLFYSEAFDGKRCIFLFTPEAHLIELIEW